MKSKTYKIVFFLILVLASIANTVNTYGQKSKKPEKFGFYFKGKRQNSSKIPFEIYSNLIVLKVKINNSDTLNFILDTGVSSFIITDQTIAEKLGLIYTRKVRINGAGTETNIDAFVSVGHSIEIANSIKADRQNLVVLSEDILKLSEFMGVPVHGIFGHDLFDRFVVKIDFASRFIYLFENEKFKIKKSYGDVYPLIVTQSKPYFEALEIAQAGKEPAKLRLVIDTGAGHALMLNTQDNSPIILPDKVLRANLGRGLNGNINGHIGRINKFKIGRFEFNNVLASFPDSLAFSMKFDENLISRQGSIGGEFLRRFTLTFNYKEGYLILKPLKSKYRETFEHDMSGLEVRVRGDQFDEYIITYVTPSSQAEKAGIQEGDQIVFLNNKHFKDLNINDIYRTLSKKEGSEIEIFYRRGSELKFAYFKLKRLI